MQSPPRRYETAKDLCLHMADESAQSIPGSANWSIVGLAGEYMQFAYVDRVVTEDLIREKENSELSLWAMPTVFDDGLGCSTNTQPHQDLRCRSTHIQPYLRAAVKRVTNIFSTSWRGNDVVQ